MHEYQFFTYNIYEKKNKFLSEPKYNAVVDFYDELIQNFELIITKIETKNNKTESIDIKYSELSAGEKNIICLVSDIITRIYFSTQKTEGFNNQEDFDNYLRDAKAIVLIDELDLHLHPKWQREILPKLRKMFPNVQFVITTHSPFVVQTLKKGTTIDLEDNNILQGNEIYSEKINITLKRMLDKDLMFNSEIEKLFEEFYSRIRTAQITKDNYEDTEIVKTLRSFENEYINYILISQKATL